MGASKTEQFTEQQNRTAALLKALAHPARIAIVQHLLKAQSCICGELVNELPLAQPTISQHLKELKHAGIVQSRTIGTTVCYCLREESIRELYDFLDQIVASFHHQKAIHCQ
ncbi:MAG: metalloregulator ArsR/SmtB family transcription factor [Cytophagales bacterium]|nr:metalloregulator ArsR/SmtB family transcription factor [Cytophagales bacterium]